MPHLCHPPLFRRNILPPSSGPEGSPLFPTGTPTPPSTFFPVSQPNSRAGTSSVFGSPL
jgi:hypothetical protein